MYIDRMIIGFILGIIFTMVVLGILTYISNKKKGR